MQLRRNPYIESTFIGLFSLDSAAGKSADTVCEAGIGNQSDMKKYNKI